MKIYKCNKCGNIVELMVEGGGVLVCCGDNMELLKAKTADSKEEKHVPFIEEIQKGYIVKVGQNANHPMAEDHYIEWIELTVDKNSYIKTLNPGEISGVEFIVKKGSVVSAKEHCNLHGLWKS